MGLISSIVNAVTGKTEEERAAAVTATVETTREPLTAVDSIPDVTAGQASTVLRARPSMFKRRKPKSMRKLRLEKGLGMLDVNGNFKSLHDIKCLGLMGCDLEVLGELLAGAVPEHAPNSTEPHPLCAV